MTDFFATDDGFSDVLARRLRRRRRRRAGLAAASAGAAVVVTIAVLSALDIGTDSLRVVPAPPAATGTPTATPSAQPGRLAPPPGTGNAAAPATAGTTSAAAAIPPPSTTSSSGSRQAAELISTAMQRTTTTYDNTKPCADTSGRAATGWCVQVLGPFSAQRGHSASLTVALCRLPGTGARAHFAGTLEADFALATTGQNSRFLWHYDAQHPDQTNDHTYRVDAGTCLQWSTTWAVRTDDGTPVPTGDYQLEVTVTADNVAAPGDSFVRQDYDYKVT